MQEENDMNQEQSEVAAETAESAVERTTVNEVESVPETKVAHRKSRVGVVTSDKMEKSIVVKVTRRVRHPLYKKYFFKSKKFMAHDEGNECGVGDTVKIVETRPLSARKRWSLDKIIERAK